MTGDTTTLIARARSLLERVQRQETRFLHGRTRGTGPRERARASHATGARKKDGSGPLRDGKRHRRTTRPSWLCAPQGMRSRAIPCRSSHSARSIPSTHCNFRLTNGVAALKRAIGIDKVNVEHPVIGVGPHGALDLRKFATTIPICQRTSQTALPAAQDTSSNVSVNTFVAIQVRDIMEKAANNMASVTSSGARAVGDTADVARVKALRHQVMRAATYTAVCRRLEHALQLYNETAPYKAPRRRQSLLPDDLNLQEQVRPRATIADLPRSTLLAIFALLDQRELALSVAPVCRQWRQLAYHRSLWRHLLLDWSSDADSGLSRVEATGALLSVTPGLVTLELVGCANVDRLLWQVVYSCRRLRTLAVDSCSVSELQKTSLDSSPCVLNEVLRKCKNLHSLIVAFTPKLARRSFFTTLGRKCWSMRCFLVSANGTETRIFFESASRHAPGTRSREDVAGARATILPSPSSTRVVDIQTESASPGSSSALLQWRLHRDHADASYFGVNVRVGLSE